MLSILLLQALSVTTGTAWVIYLGKQKGVAGEREQYEAVRDADMNNGPAGERAFVLCRL